MQLGLFLSYCSIYILTLRHFKIVLTFINIYFFLILQALHTDTHKKGKGGGEKEAEEEAGRKTENKEVNYNSSSSTIAPFSLIGILGQSFKYQYFICF